MDLGKETLPVLSPETVEDSSKAGAPVSDPRSVPSDNGYANLIKNIAIIILTVLLIAAIGVILWHYIGDSELFSSSSKSKSKKKKDDEQTSEIVSGGFFDLSVLNEVKRGPEGHLSGGSSSYKKIYDYEIKNFLTKYGLSCMNTDDGIFAYNDEMTVLVTVKALPEYEGMDDLIEQLFEGSELLSTGWEMTDGLLQHEAYLDEDDRSLGYNYTAIVLLPDQAVIIQGLSTSPSATEISEAKDLVEAFIEWAKE